jgi:hypothetical protein
MSCIRCRVSVDLHLCAVAPTVAPERGLVGLLSKLSGQGTASEVCRSRCRSLGPFSPLSNLEMAGGGRSHTLNV